MIERVIGVFFLLILCCFFSPCVSVGGTSFFQGMKACDMICMLGIYLLLMYAWRYSHGRGFHFKFSRLDVIVLIYSTYLFLLVVLSWEHLDREVVLCHMACGMLYLAARNAGEWQHKQIIVLFPFVLLWQLWYGIAEQTLYFYPGMGIGLVRGSFLNTGIWSCFVACVGVLLCGLVGLNSSWWMKFVCGVGCVSGIALLYVGNSRAAWLGFIVGVGFLCYKQVKRIRGTTRWVAIGILFVLMVVAGMSTMHKGDSALGRVFIWKISGQMCLEQPQGRGMDGFRRDYMDYQQRYFATGGSVNEKRLADDNLFAFNDLLRVSVEQGVVGIILSFLLVYHIFRKDESSGVDGRMVWVLKSVVVVLLVFSLFSYPASQLQVKGILILFMAMLSSLKTEVWSFNGKWLVIPGVVAVLLAGGRLVLPYRGAIQAWDDCLKRKDVPGEYVSSVLFPLRNNSIFLSNCALLLNAGGETEAAASVAGRGVSLYHSYACCIELGIAMERLGKLSLAEQAWEYAGNLVPNRFRPLYLRMEMWMKAGDREKALELAERLLYKGIKVRSPELYYFLERAKQVKLILKTDCL